ncbi:hypothetical protein DNTS_026036, partial [Danionella cerebrum]
MWLAIGFFVGVKGSITVKSLKKTEGSVTDDDDDDAAAPLVMVATETDDARGIDKDGRAGRGLNHWSHVLKMSDNVSQSSRLECQICFNEFSQRRRPKLLHCQHTCCSVCLSQMRLSQRVIRCPWCRCPTQIPSGLSISHLPDDPEVLSVISVSHSSEHTPIFVHLPNNGFLLPMDIDGALLHGQSTCRFVPKGTGMLDISDGRNHVLVDDTIEDGMGEEVSVKSTAWTGVCTVLLVAFILIFLLGIVLHNMSCVSKRFTIISC